ncbi:SNF2 family N-terminal domain-containing protein [Chlamydoabsidia padenii]|nr:SNF2 family N-terminal domain-containing protein [Chlamydoabsidia padenii]
MCQQEQSDIKGGMLADDMGLGKTIQSLALIVGRPCTDNPPIPTMPASKSKKLTPFKVKTNLIVCPPTLMAQWAEEIKTKTENLSVYLFHGYSRITDPTKLATYDVIIMPYTLLINEFSRERHPMVSTMYEMIFHRVILDEAHTIKNPQSVTTRSSYNIRATYRWCLTATPFQSKISDIQSLIKFLRFEPYCDSGVFRREILKPISLGVSVLDKIQSILKVIYLRRTKKIQTGERPLIVLRGKEEHIVRADFTEPEQQAYDLINAKVQTKFNEFLANDGREYTKGLCLLMELRKACIHPFKNAPGRVAHRQDHANNAFQISIAKSISQTVVERLKNTKEFFTNLECPICMDTTEDPYIIPGCGHVLCHECLNTYCNSPRIYNYQNSCPECRGPLQYKRTISTDIFLKVHLPDRISPENTEQHKAKASKEEPVSKKISILVDILTEARQKSEGKDKTIVFSQFSEILTVMERALPKLGFKCMRYDGTITISKRSAVLKSFQNDPTIEVLLISTKSGSVGLNMNMANRVVLMEVGWNSAMENQAIGRVYRIGQMKKVDIYRIFINNTVEDRIFELHQRRKGLVDDIFNEKVGQSQSERLGLDEMIYLIHGGTPPFNNNVVGPST